MLTPEHQAELEHQQYRIVGKHSAVKICGWTRSMINGKGGCYKLKFYGIMSNQCLQMTTSLSCANRCTFCWRGYKAPVSKEWQWGVDDPQLILTKSIQEHHQLLIGFNGSDKINREAYEQSKKVKHVALSLTGEPINYPKINELIDLFHQQEISTFLVTNAQYPEQIKNLQPVTQLYLSLDAPTKELLKEIDKPLFTDYWERLNQSLGYLAQKKQRTCIRLTLIKEANMVLPEKYAELINQGNPDFIEVKAYMFVGPSRQRLQKENMPVHEEVVNFSTELIKHLPDYEIVSEHLPSRVVMLAKKKYKKIKTNPGEKNQSNGWHTWIDFDKFQTAYKIYLKTGKEFSADDYSCKTPEVGLSGQGTLQRMHPKLRTNFIKERKIFVNESTEETNL
ncbi:MAG: 4-demethylwyosine synthase TYW1 [Nanoarchaeota archaeon]